MVKDDNNRLLIAISRVNMRVQNSIAVHECEMNLFNVFFVTGHGRDNAKINYNISMLIMDC
jgi:hypothetical protein